MIYQKLFEHFRKKERNIKVGIIGAGHYGTAVITQSMFNSYLDIPIIADSNIKAARSAYNYAGISDEDIVECDSYEEAIKIIEKGKYAIVQDPMILMNLPLDIIAESTGIPEAGALYGYSAIKNGKHIAMINKETDSVVGPILKHMADKAGLVYTPVDGDQHGLLMGLVSWAKSLGLEIICAGKARDTEFIYDKQNCTVTDVRDEVIEGGPIAISKEDLVFLDNLPDDEILNYTGKRKEILRQLNLASDFDLSELVIAANAMNLVPDISEIHLPVVRTSEIPKVLCSKEDGGILSQKGVIDTVTPFREKHEAGLGGGVFIVVSSKNEYSRRIMNSKGLIHNSSGKASLIYRPHHLCGVETSTSLLCAVILGISTGYEDYLPRFDVVRKTRHDMKKGEILGDDYTEDFRSMIIPAVTMSGDSLIPAHLFNGNKLTRDIPAGTLITFDMVERPVNSILWQLRLEQEKHFLG